VAQVVELRPQYRQKKKKKRNKNKDSWVWWPSLVISAIREADGGK
jgi:hypothetical protein